MEYIRYLHTGGGSVANVIGSSKGNLVEKITYGSQVFFVSLFEKAKGKQLAENRYRYREGVPITEYYYNCGKTLGKLHQLSKSYSPTHTRSGFSDKFNAEYIDKLLPDSLSLLKRKMLEILSDLEDLGKNPETYGMVHFDYNDGNYSIDFDTGQITVYDFDNACFCWYMFDLAAAWTNGVGWTQFEPNAAKRKEFMDKYFGTVGHVPNQ